MKNQYKGAMTTQMLLLRFLPIVGLWLLLGVYVGYRLISPMSVRRTWKIILWVCVAILLVLPILTMLVARGANATHPVISFLPWPGFFAMGIVSIIFVFTLVRDVLLGVNWFVQMLLAKARSERPLPQDPTRRKFIGNAVNFGIIGTTGVIAGSGARSALQVPEVVEVDIPLVSLPADLEGFRIVQLTDIHVGPTIKSDYLTELVGKANALSPDLIVVTGDLIDGHVHELAEHVAPLAKLTARHGVYFVTGNHEYYWDAPAWIAYISSLGLRVLNNQHEVISHQQSKLVIAGVTDASAGNYVPNHRSDPAKAFADAPTDLVRIFLAHQPRSFFAAENVAFDIQISGHTHGGQYFPMSVLVHLFQPFVAGLYRHSERWIYVSRGCGYWGPPIRFAAPTEISLIRLVRAY